MSQNTTSAAATNIHAAIQALCADFEQAAQTRKGLVGWLKDQDAYAGHSRDSMIDLMAHALRVQEARVAEARQVLAQVEAEAAAEQAPAAEPTKPAPKKARKPGKVRGTLRPATVAKLAAVLANATADENGVIVATADDFVAAGLGGTWVRTPNRAWTTPSDPYCVSLTALGYTAQSSRGAVVFTPLATEATDEQAS